MGETGDLVRLPGKPECLHGAAEVSCTQTSDGYGPQNNVQGAWKVSSQPASLLIAEGNLAWSKVMGKRINPLLHLL